MAALLNETVDPADLRKFEHAYHNQLNSGSVTPNVKFDYCWCLVRSKYSADIQKGVVLLEELYNTHESGQRDYIYYLAMGNAKLKEYTKALKYCKAFLNVEPGNMQVVTLEQAIRKKMEQESLRGIAAAGGAVIALGAILGVVMALASKSKS